METIVLQSGSMSYETAAISIIGSRSEQQDTFLLQPCEGRLLVCLCDGMGGLCNGREAGIRTAENLKLLHTQKRPEEAYPDFFYRAVKVLDQNLQEHSQRTGTGHSGTTLVAAAMEDRKLYWASVGDSRMYIIRNQEMVRVTADHNYFMSLNEARKQGRISEEDFRAEQCRGDALISYIGMGGVEIMDYNRRAFRITEGDVLLLATDGLYRCLSEPEILRICISQQSPSSIAEELIRAVCEKEKKNQDNTSVIVTRVRER